MHDAPTNLEIIRHRIEHEDNLLNQRVAWVVSSQAFLLTGYAILLNGPAQFGSEALRQARDLLMTLIPLTSIAVTALIWVAILAAILAMRDLRISASRHPSDGATYIQGRALTRRVGLTVPVVIPLVFLTTWLLLILH